MIEFGAPYLEIREPMKGKARSTAKVERIESCNWTLRTRIGAASSQGETSDFRQDWMDDLSGQRLVSVESPASGALTLRFDMGAALEVKPDADGDLDSWSLYPRQGRVTACDAMGRITVEPEKA